MGIERNVAQVVLREHAWRPIVGEVLLLGRQTMFFSPEDAIGMLRECSIPVPEIQFSRDTKTRLAEDSYIRDDDFFRLLGIPKIKSLDVSDYEGADIVHDLTKPIPASLEGVADFILDGSTLDNVFDPATALRNMARLLKPGGRFVSINVASNHYGPYIILTPHWLLDYLIMNGFVDCKVYVFVYGGPDGGMNVLTPDLTVLRRDLPQPQNLVLPNTMGLVVMAEKGDNSTWDRTPIQHQYRDVWDDFERNLRVIRSSKRPDVARSTADQFVAHPDFRFVDRQRQSSEATAMDHRSQPTPPQVSMPPNLADVYGRDLVRELGKRLRARAGRLF